MYACVVFACMTAPSGARATVMLQCCSASESMPIAVATLFSTKPCSHATCQTIYAADTCVRVISADYIHTWIGCINGLTQCSSSPGAYNIVCDGACQVVHDMYYSLSTKHD